MSAFKFKIGNRVRVRPILGIGWSGNVYVNPKMRDLVGKVLTIKDCDGSRYRVVENEDEWNDELLEPVEKDLYNLEKGDFVDDGDGPRKILAVLDGCYLLSYIEDTMSAQTWFTAFELDKNKYSLVLPYDTVTIDNRQYKKSEVRKAIKGLKPIK